MAMQLEHEEIIRMLDAGQIARPDRDGFMRELHTTCPHDGHTTQVHRINRNGRAISGVIFRCPACSADVTAEPSLMFLH